MVEANFIITELEENSILEAFSHIDSWDPDSESKIYSSPLIGVISNEALIQSFICNVLNGEYYYDKVKIVSEKSATNLLRQMAMFEIDWNNTKTQHCNANEAKLASKLIVNFMGLKTEFFTNVISTEHPHDNPGKVLTNDSDGSHDSISFWAINQEYIVFINQTWNHSGG